MNIHFSNKKEKFSIFSIMDTIKVLVPAFYGEFRCLGGTCPDTCCKDWGEIAIDKETWKKYKNSTSKEFNQKLQTAFKAVKEPDGSINSRRAAVVVLNEHKMCSFLTKDGLCEIQQKMGYHYLSFICKNYPRSELKIFGGNLEASLWPSCIEVARLALLHEGKQKFIKIEMDRKGISAMKKLKFSHEQSILHSMAKDIREVCINIMQNDEISILQRIFHIAFFLQELEQAYLQNKSTDEIKILLNNSNNAGKEVSIDAQKIMTVVGKKGKRFMEFIEIIREITGSVFGQETADKMPPQEIHKYIIENSKTEWENVLKDKALIFENYFVNFIFAFHFPFCYQKLSPFNHIFLFLERLELLQLFLGAYAIKFGKIGDENIIKIVNKIEQAFSDGERSAARILQLYLK